MLLYETESYAILGACFEVYKQQGVGFLEPVYQECLKIEFGIREIPFVSHPKLMLEYKGHELQQYYEPDFVCFGKIIIEIKSVAALNDVFRAQVHHYLKATKMRLGLLVNFSGHPKLQYERIII